MKIVHLFLLMVCLIVHLNGQCTWRGRAPFCSPSWCDADEFDVHQPSRGLNDHDYHDYGRHCWHGWKKFCCKLRSCYISARFLCMPASCKDGDMFIRGYIMGDGSYCLSGWQAFCCSGVPSGPVKVTLYEDSNYRGASESFNGESQCIDVKRPNTASSVQTHGTCVRVFSRRRCKGQSISLSAVSPAHGDLHKRGFPDAIRSIGPCLPNDHARWDPKFLDDVVIFGQIPHLAIDRHHVKEPVVFFQTGHGGRTESMQAVISRRHLDTGSPPTNRSGKYVHRLGRDGDDAGLILGAILGGSGEDERNLFPQSPYFNRDAFARFEGVVADLVSAEGDAVYSVNLQYQGTETRPKRIILRIEYDLKGYKSVFTNDFLNP